MKVVIWVESWEREAWWCEITGIGVAERVCGTTCVKNPSSFALSGSGRGSTSAGLSERAPHAA